MIRIVDGTIEKTFDAIQALSSFVDGVNPRDFPFERRGIDFATFETNPFSREEMLIMSEKMTSEEWLALPEKEYNERVSQLESVLLKLRMRNVFKEVQERNGAVVFRLLEDVYEDPAGTEFLGWVSKRIWNVKSTDKDWQNCFRAERIWHEVRNFRAITFETITLDKVDIIGY